MKFNQIVESILQPVVQLTDEQFNTLYDIVNRWSSGVEQVKTEEMSVIKQYQPLFEYKGNMHRVIWLTPYKELSKQEINKLDVKQSLSQYKHLHTEFSWGKSLEKIKNFAYDYLSEMFFEELEDQKIQQLITVLCKQRGTGFDIQKFLNAYNNHFKKTDYNPNPIGSAAEIEEVIAPFFTETLAAKVVKNIDDIPGILNRSEDVNYET
jgi:hypothetical protein